MHAPPSYGRSLAVDQRDVVVAAHHCEVESLKLVEWIQERRQLAADHIALGNAALRESRTALSRLEAVLQSSAKQPVESDDRLLLSARPKQAV